MAQQFRHLNSCAPNSNQAGIDQNPELRAIRILKERWHYYKSVYKLVNVKSFVEARGRFEVETLRSSGSNKRDIVGYMAIRHVWARGYQRWKSPISFISNLHIKIYLSTLERGPTKFAAYLMHLTYDRIRGQIRGNWQKLQCRRRISTRLSRSRMAPDDFPLSYPGCSIPHRP